MEDGDTEKYYPSRVIQDFVFLIRERGCIRCFSLHVYNKNLYLPLREKSRLHKMLKRRREACAPLSLITLWKIDSYTCYTTKRQYSI